MPSALDDTLLLSLKDKRSGLKPKMFNALLSTSNFPQNKKDPLSSPKSYLQLLPTPTSLHMENSPHLPYLPSITLSQKQYTWTKLSKSSTRPDRWGRRIWSWMDLTTLQNPILLFLPDPMERVLCWRRFMDSQKGLETFKVCSPRL